MGSLLELITAIGYQVTSVYSKKFSMMVKWVDSGVKMLESKSKFYHAKLCDLGQYSNLFVNCVIYSIELQWEFMS